MELKAILDCAFRRRKALFNKSDTDCFRLFNGEGDGLDGLSIDLYGDYILVQYFNGIVFSLLASGKIDADMILSVLSGYPVQLKGILVKNRLSLKGDLDYGDIRKSTLLYGSLPPDDHIVKQNGILCSVDLVDGQSTGIFLDMREIRHELELFYKSNSIENMLNLFCYTALFSVHALFSGVKHATNIDLSRAVLERARRNYALNNLSTDGRDFIYGDAVDWARALVKKKRTYSFVVVDPPTFSRNRQKSFSVRHDYGTLLKSVDRLLDGGYALTSVNSHGISVDEYRSYHPSGWEPVFISHESSDFPSAGDYYLKAGLWEIHR